MRLDAEIAELIATDPALAGRDTIDMPYLTCVYRMCPARRRSQRPWLKGSTSD
jgi:hypothetical protein